MIRPHFDPEERSERRRELLVRALDENPNDTDARSLLSFILLGQGRHEDAFCQARRVIEQQQDNPLALYVVSVLSKRTDGAGALEAIKRAIAVEPNDPIYYGRLAHLLLRSTNRFSRSDFIFKRRAILIEALRASGQGLALDSRNCLCLFIRAEALARLWRFRESADTLETLINLYPKMIRFRVHLILNFILRFRWLKAAEAIRIYLKCRKEQE
jgi:tetratricopeptide (TPR) repeat protein